MFKIIRIWGAVRIRVRKSGLLVVDFLQAEDGPTAICSVAASRQ